MALELQYDDEAARVELMKALAKCCNGYSRLVAQTALAGVLMALWGESGCRPSIEMVHKLIDQLAAYEVKRNGH